MTAFLTLVIITAFFSIILTIRTVGKVSLARFLHWCGGVILGILMLIYITLPLMEWSVILNTVFWILSFTQLVLVIKELANPKFTRQSTTQREPIVILHEDKRDIFQTEAEALRLMNHLQTRHIPFNVIGL